MRIPVPVAGATAFALPMSLPLPGAVRRVLVLLTFCSADVVMIYTRAAGSSYVVARDDFGPDVALLVR